MTGPDGASVPFLTVGGLRALLADLPDDAQVALTTVQGGDQGIIAGHASRLIPWAHACTDADDDHRPGIDCPTAWGLEVWTATPDDAEQADEKPSPKRARS